MKQSLRNLNLGEDRILNRKALKKIVGGGATWCGGLYDDCSSSEPCCEPYICSENNMCIEPREICDCNHEGECPEGMTCGGYCDPSGTTKLGRCWP